MEPLRFSGSITPNYEEFLGEHRCLLEQAVEKVVRVAQRVGVTPEEIVSLLDSGIMCLKVVDTRRALPLELNTSSLACSQSSVAFPSVPPRS